MTHPRQFVFCLVASALLAAITLIPWGPLEIFELKTLDVRMWVRDRFDPPTPRSRVQTLVLDDAALNATLHGGEPARVLHQALDGCVRAALERPGVLGVELPLWHPVATPLFQGVVHDALEEEEGPAWKAQGSLVVGMRSGNSDEALLFGLEAFAPPPLGEPGRAAATVRTGAVDFAGDHDGVVRWVPLADERDGQLFPTFLLQLVAAYDEISLQDVRVRLGRHIELWKQGNVVRRIPIDGKGRLLVNYRERPASACRPVSAAAAEGAPFLPQRRLVLLGTSAPSVTEHHNVPVGGRVAEVEIMAEAMQTILSEDFIHPVGATGRFFITWSILFLGSLGMVRLPSWRGVALGFGIVVAYFFLEKALFLAANVWLPFMLPVTAFTWGAAVFPVYGFRWRAKRHMEEMRLLRRFDDLVLMNIAGGLLVADRNGIVLRHNPRAAELLGRGGEALHGQHVRELFAVSPAMLELLGQVMRRSHEASPGGGIPASTRVAVPSRGGANERIFDLEVALVDPALLRSQRHADLPCYVLTFDDVTEQVQRAHEEARQARLAAVGEIAAKLGHEIRNSLGGLKLYLENLNDGIIHDGSKRALIGKMVREIDSLHRKMDDLRKFGLDPQVELAPCSIKELLDEALTFANEKLSQKHIRVVLECERGLAALWGDPRQMREALQNLINNAIEAAPEGGRVAIQVERIAGGNGSDAGTTRIHIEDNGPGIPLEIREHVFSLFFTTKPDIGTGLGLPIAKKIIEGHGGSLSFSCGSHGGARFTVSLPSRDQSEVSN